MKKTLMMSVSTMMLYAALGHPVAMAEPLKVVSSFSILGDLVHQVGGDKVQSISIIGPESDAHSFEPRPSDAKTLQSADLLIINGAHFEAWLPKLSQAAGYKGKVVEAIQGVPLRAYEDEHEHEHDPSHTQTHAHTEGHAHHHDHDHSHDHGDYDPHAWQSLEHAQMYVSTIRDALSETDPDNTVYYQKRAADYIQAMQALNVRLLAEFEKIPASQRSVVTSHDAFNYLGQAYGVEFLSLLGASNQAEPSAKELAGLIEYMRDNRVQAVFMENISSPKLIEQIARETGAKVGKHLYSDALAKAPHPADTYLGMMQWNAEALLEVLRPN